MPTVSVATFSRVRENSSCLELSALTRRASSSVAAAARDASDVPVRIATAWNRSSIVAFRVTKPQDAIVRHLAATKTQVSVRENGTQIRVSPALFNTADDIERVFKSGKIASLMGMEGGHSIDSSLPTLHMFYRLGVRYMTLTHSSNIPWADSATDTPKLGGLSKFGEAVVAEMNWLGMLVDLSHVSPDTMEDALRVTQAPVIFSHSSARALCDVPRDVPDAVLQKLPANGGVVMVTFVPGFISQETADHGKLQQAERERLQKRYPKDEEKVRAEMAAWSSAHPEPRASLAQVADHIDHIKQVAGIDHIGIGSDFDGIGSVPVGLEDVSKYPALTAELVRRGYNDDDIRKILGLNVLRALRGAEGVAKKLQAERQPSVKTIQELDEGKPPVVERER